MTSKSYVILCLLAAIALGAAGCGGAEERSVAPAGDAADQGEVMAAESELTDAPLTLPADAETASPAGATTDEPTMTAADGESSEAPLTLTVAEQPAPAAVDSGVEPGAQPPASVEITPGDTGEDEPTVTVEASGPAVVAPFAVTSWDPVAYLGARGWAAPLPISAGDAADRLGTSLDTSSLGVPDAFFASAEGTDAEIVAFWPSTPAILSTTPFLEENGAAHAATAVADFGPAVCDSCTRYGALTIGGALPAHVIATPDVASLVWAEGNVLRTLILSGAAVDELVPTAESLLRSEGGA